MKKTIALLIALAALLSGSALAADLSDWAKEDYEIISKSGILTQEIVSGNLRKPITREEVAVMMVNFFSQISDKAITKKKNPFSDTESEDVITAYSAGIVSGKGGSIFDPSGAVTRQEFAKMLLNTFEAANIAPDVSEEENIEALMRFEDGEEVAGWAQKAFCVALENGIIKGVSSKKLVPQGNALREQAVCIVSRAYEKFAEKRKSYASPKLLENQINVSGDMDFTWTEVSGAKKYFVLLKDEQGEILERFETKSPSTTIYSVDYATGTYSITLGAELASGEQTFTEPMDFSFSAPIVTPPYVPTEKLSLSLAQKEARVFPNGTAFQTADEAKQNMVTVTVPVWRIGSDGSKYSREAELVVNAALADDVIAIFNEIFNSPEQFPIKALSGYTWRNTSGGRLSQHSYGTCIDINPTENYYVDPDGTPLTGEYWKPYEDPYSMPEDGIVVRTFAKYGWEWGGNCWSDKYAKDYMHFTYLGK